MGELRAEVGDRFGLFQVLERYVPRAGAQPVEERAFLTPEQGRRLRQPERIRAQGWTEIWPGRGDLRSPVGAEAGRSGQQMLLLDPLQGVHLYGGTQGVDAPALRLTACD
jgi:hypothetical protein